MDADTRHVTRAAGRLAAQLERRARASRPPRGPARLLRPLALAWQIVARKARTLVREHWDVAAFDVLFGSLKAFGVYPALYFAGLAWTIPLMEYAPLNTQLWTAGYLVVRGELLSERGRRRYGHPLKQLDALRDRLLGVWPRDARHLHRFELDGARRLLRVRRSHFRTWLARCRGLHEEGVVRQAELRSWLRDPEFRFRANPLRANPYLYECVLLAKLVATPEAHAGLLAASVPDEPCPDEERALRNALDGVPVTALARVTEQADSLGAALRARLGHAWSARCLRWTHASLRRALRGRLSELEDLQYRLLAERLEGGALRTSAHWPALCRKRAEIRAWIARAGSLARRGKQVRSEAEARRVAHDVIRDARSRGLQLRRARLAAWLCDLSLWLSPLPWSPQETRA